MSQSLKSLPIGIFRWKDICEYNMFFVDKTARLGTLVTNQRKIFLSRPRRMGKTTLVSQLEDLFTNGVKNFKNTAIYDKWPYQDTCPVINLSFINVKGDTIDEVVVSLQRNLARAYNKAGFDSVVASDKPDLESFLDGLARISWQHQLVFLIDEWDYLLSNNLHDQVFCDELLSQFRKFYDWLRMLENVRFILVTGIMRYHSASLFTGQDIVDISMEPRWADLLGITHDELVTCYAPYIKVAAERLGWSEGQLIAQLKEHYDGFCFDRALSVKLYSPYALNRFFAPIVNDNEDEENKAGAQVNLEFLPYWMNSSNATAALRAYLTSRPVDLLELKSLIDSNFDIEINEFELIEPVDFSQVTLRSILTNAGYLTIKDKKVVSAQAKNSSSPLSEIAALDAALGYKTELTDIPAATLETKKPNMVKKTEVIYVCGFPNLDVSSQFMDVVEKFIAVNINSASGFEELNMALGVALEQGDIGRACNIINELLGGILFDAFQDVHEAFYRTVIADWLRRSFRDVREEQPNYRGRSDIEITTRGKMVIVFELKLIKDRADESLDYASDDTFAWIKDEVLEPATVQIFDRGYGINHHNIAKPVTGVILALSQRERRIVAWRKYAPDSGMTEGWLPASDMYHKLVESKGRLVGKAKPIKATSSSSSKAKGKAKSRKA